MDLAATARTDIHGWSRLWRVAAVSVARVERARLLGDAELLVGPERRARRAYPAATGGRRSWSG